MSTFLRALALVALIASGCSAPSGLSLPIVSRGRELVPVEGLETPELASRARCAVLTARAEKPIEIALRPSGERREHAIRGEVVALAGPTPAGTFVYAVRDPEDRDEIALRRGDLRGSDRDVGRFRRRISALSLAPDGARAAILAPFDEGDARSRGDVLKELVLVSIADGSTDATGFACWNAAPAWLADGRLACVVANEAGAREVVVIDASDPSRRVALGPGDRVLAEPGDSSLLVFRRDGERVFAFRVASTGGEAVAVDARGVVEPLAALDGGLLVAYSAPTLGAESQWELDLLGPQIPLATIKLHDLADGSFATVEPRASPRRLWSAGRLDP